MSGDFNFPYHPEEDVEEFESGRSGCSRLTGCLFAGLALVVIISLLGTSSLAYFLVQRQAESSIQTEATNEEIAEMDVPPIQSGDPLPTVEPTVVTVATATPLATPPATPDITDLGRIALITDEGQLETIAPDGSERRQLTSLSDRTFFQFPAWSPETGQLAAVGTDRQGSGIFVLKDEELEGTLEDNRIYFSTIRTPFYLYWSPDSQAITFLADDPQGSIELHIVDGVGMEDSRLLATGSPLYWDWSADGQLLLVHSGDNGPHARVAAIDLEGKQQTENIADPGLFQAPDVSAGGLYWTYAEDAGRGVSALILADAASGERRTVEQARSVAMNWSPIKQQLAYISGSVQGRPYWGQLRLVDAETGEKKLLTTETVLAFFWSPDGRSIAYISVANGENNAQEARSPAKTSRVSRVDQPVQQHGHGFLSLSVIDIATGLGLRLLEFQPTGSYFTQFLPFFSQYALSHQIWSPDSQAVVVPVRSEQGEVIMIVPVDGAQPTNIADGNIAFWSWR